MNNIDIINTNTNTNTNTDSDFNQISMIEISKIIDTIGNEQSKDKFIDNYTRYKKIITHIDNILSDENNIVNELENKDITELFGILENYQNKISNPETIGPMDLKYISLLINQLEKKINDDKLKISEFK